MHFMSQSGYNTPALIQRIEVPPVSLLCAPCSAGGEKCDQEGLDKAKSRGSYEAGSKPNFPKSEPTFFTSLYIQQDETRRESLLGVITFSQSHR